MTPAQEEAVAQAKKILKEHFDAFSISTRYCDEHEIDRINSDWYGSLSDVLGIHHFTTVRLEYIVIHGKLP